MATAVDLASVSRAGDRPVNEDCAGSLEIASSTCIVVADGLGGHRGGELASRVAVDAVLESFKSAPHPTPENVTAHIRRAHAAILDRQRREPAMAHMRSTIAVLVARDNDAVWGHVGDTRLYRVRDGRVIARTKDHSVIQALVDAGDVAPGDQGQHEDRSRLRRSLGKEGDLGETVHGVAALQDGDAFLLCTDGFWEALSDAEIAIDYCATSTAASWVERLEARVARRIAAGKDNYTAVAARLPASVRRETSTAPEAERESVPVDVPAPGRATHRGRFAAFLVALIIAGALIVWSAPTIARTVSEWRPGRPNGEPMPRAGGETAHPVPGRAPTNR